MWAVVNVLSRRAIRKLTYDSAHARRMEIDTLIFCQLCLLKLHAVTILFLEF
jgi:hypothetical protein